MAYITGTASNRNNLLDIIRSLVNGWGKVVSQNFSGTGTGTMGFYFTAPSVTETWTVTCTAAATNGGTFSVTGSVSGAKAAATVGVDYRNDKIGFVINDGLTDFIVGDSFTISVQVGQLQTEGKAWTEKEIVINGADERLFWFQAPGLTGSEQIFNGFQSYQSIPGDYYNINVSNATGWVNGNTFSTQPGNYGRATTLWNQPMPFWLCANGQRVTGVIKVQNNFESFYIGKFLPYATPGQYPYPTLTGGTIAFGAPTRYSVENAATHYSWWLNRDGQTNLPLRGPANTVIYPGVHPYCCDIYSSIGASFSPRPTYNSSASTLGDYGLYPLILTDPSNVYGEVDGWFYINGYNNAAENICTISGQDYLVLRDITRTGLQNYAALKLA